LTNLQYPDREEFLVALGSKMASATELASIEDIELLWFELQREIVESGKIVRFNHLVFQADGEQAEQEIIRVGLFNIISSAGYLKVNDDGSVSEMGTQPDSRLTGSASDLMRRNGWRHSGIAGAVSYGHGSHPSGRYRRLLHHFTRRIGTAHGILALVGFVGRQSSCEGAA